MMAWGDRAPLQRHVNRLQVPLPSMREREAEPDHAFGVGVVEVAPIKTKVREIGRVGVREIPQRMNTVPLLRAAFAELEMEVRIHRVLLPDGADDVAAGDGRTGNHRGRNAV